MLHSQYHSLGGNMCKCYGCQCGQRETSERVVELTAAIIAVLEAPSWSQFEKAEALARIIANEPAPEGEE